MNHIPHFRVFNPRWWTYYRQAVTIYQVHSPFVFDFLTKVKPEIENQPRRNLASGWQNEPNVLNNWLPALIFHYKVSRLFTPLSLDSSDTAIIGDLLDEMTGQDYPDTNNAWMHIPTTECPKSIQPTGPVFEAIGIVGPDWTAETLNLFLRSIHSGLLIFQGIHSHSNRFTRWKHLKSYGDFHFSIELYNLGLLFMNQVNKQPEHLTYIDWKLKPWKTLTI